MSTSKARITDPKLKPGQKIKFFLTEEWWEGEIIEHLPHVHSVFCQDTYKVKRDSDGEIFERKYPINIVKK